MKNPVRVLALILCLMMVLPAVAEENTRETEVLNFIQSLDNVQIEGLNAFTSSYEDVAAALGLSGEGVDMLTNPGYVKKYDGTYDEAMAFADKAIDFGGVGLVWFDLVNGSEYTENYNAMAVNSGVIVIMGGMYTVSTDANNGAFALCFAEGCDEQVKADKIAALKAIDAAKPFLSLYSITDLARALQKAKFITVQDFAKPEDLNAVYTYVAEGKDWLGYYDAESNPNGTESGYSDPYDKTYTVKIASTANKYGDITIYFFNTTDSMFQYGGAALTLQSLKDTLAEDGSATGTIYADMDGDWTYEPFTVNGTEYAEGGEVATFTVDAIIGNFAIVID